MALFRAMLVLFELLLAIFFEKTTKKDQRNSSKPSSQTEKDETSCMPGTNGKGKLENDERFTRSRTRKPVKIAKATVCDLCGEDLSQLTCRQHERRTKIDVLFEKVIPHVDAEIKICPHWHGQTRGVFPADMPDAVTV